MAKPGKTTDFTPVQKQLIDQYMIHGTYAEAYRAVCPDAAGDAQRMDRAGRAFTARMRAEIARRKKVCADAVDAALAEDATAAALRWSRLDSLDTLIDIIDRCKKEQARGFSARVASVTLDAIAIINRMQGYDAPQKSDVNGAINVVFDDADGYGV